MEVRLGCETEQGHGYRGRGRRYLEPEGQRAAAECPGSHCTGQVGEMGEAPEFIVIDGFQKCLGISAASYVYKIARLVSRVALLVQGSSQVSWGQESYRARL